MLRNMNSFCSFQNIETATQCMPAAKVKTQNWWKVSPPSIFFQRNVEFAGISTCCGVFRLLRLRFLEASPFNCASSQWLELVCRCTVPDCSSLPSSSQKSQIKVPNICWVIPLCVHTPGNTFTMHRPLCRICAVCTGQGDLWPWQ